MSKVFALHCKATDPGIVTLNGRLASHQSVREFATREEFNAALDATYTGRDGYNLVEIPESTFRKFDQSWMEEFEAQII